MADWSKLPKELLELIAKRLETCFDTIHFRSVCCSWRSSVPPRSRHLYAKCLLPSFGDYFQYEENARFYLEKFPVFLFRFSKSSRNQTSAAADCWLVGISERSYGKTKLVSPLPGSRPILSGSRILLNTLNCQILPLGHEYTVQYPRWRDSLEGEKLVSLSGKAVFLPLDKEDGDFAVLTELSSKNLVMFRTTDMRWSVLEDTPERCQDMVSFKGKFYAVDEKGRTAVIEPSLEVSFLPDIGARATAKMLVQSGNELLLVDIFSPSGSLRYNPQHRLIWCRVFKLDEEAQRWVRVEDLGDRLLFLCRNWNFSCSANELPGLKGNCIIFGKWFDFEPTAFVFNLRDGSVRNVEDLGIFRPDLESATSSGFVMKQNTEASFCELHRSPPA